MIDRLLAMKPEDVPIGVIAAVLLVGLVCGVWVQWRLTSASDRWLRRGKHRRP